MRRAIALADVDPGRYQCHPLHAPERIWVEKNCYVDIWIELLHALKLEPMAMLAFTVAVDFEGDQWTFFKPPHDDLRDLYGIDVQELYVWRPLIEHALEHLGVGKFISTEADAFWLPDTAGSDYRRQHTKTTIVLGAIDLDARRLDYFHNGGYFSLEGEDFVKTFRLDSPPDPTFMPLFAELVRHDRALRRGDEALRSIAFAQLRKHIARRPLINPILSFQERFERDLPELTRQGLALYHVWVFGTLRQLGAAAELSALFLRWLGNDAELEAAAEAFTDLSQLCKTMILKIARAVNAGRPMDGSASFAAMAAAWQRTDSALRTVE
ncbi:MAG: DUF1839 family protein [Steroidobacteraceae bacterium]